MNIYEINALIESCINYETGEVDIDRLQELQLLKDEKIEQTALWLKNMTAEALAIKAEEKNLGERRKVLENRCESLKNYLMSATEGQKFETSKVKISYRKSKKLVFDDEFTTRMWLEEAGFDRLITYGEPKLDKAGLKKLILDGVDVPACHLEEGQSMQIK